MPSMAPATANSGTPTAVPGTSVGVALRPHSGLHPHTGLHPHAQSSSGFSSPPVASGTLAPA